MRLSGGRLFRVKVHAGSNRDNVQSLGPNAFVVWVRSKPERGKANAAALALLGRHLSIEPKRLRILKGAASPNKIVTLLGS